MFDGLAALTLALLAVNPYLEKGRRAYESLSYEDAERQLWRAVELTTSTEAEQRLAHDLLARALVAQGKLAEAEKVFAQLVSKDPLAPEPDAGPKLRALFIKAKRGVFPPGYVRLAELPSDKTTLALEVADPWGEVAAVTAWVAADGRGFAERTMTRTGMRAQLRLAEPRDQARYYFEARAADGRVLARLAGPALPPEPALVTALGASPPAVGPAAEPARRWRPIPWGLSAAAVALGSIGAALAVASSRDSAEAGSQRFAARAKALDDSAYDKALAAHLLVGGAALAGASGALLFWVW